jgi:hypothetical protein
MTPPNPLPGGVDRSALYGRARGSVRVSCAPSEHDAFPALRFLASRSSNHNITSAALIKQSAKSETVNVMIACPPCHLPQNERYT